MLQGSDQTPASQAQTDDQVGSTEIEPTPEEAEYNKLSGSVQHRIRQLVQQKRAADERATRFESERGSVPPPAPGQTQFNPEVQNARQTLTNIGMATKDDVTNTVNETLANLRFEQEMQRLENNFTGSKGEPTFVREEYEDYVRSHPQFKTYMPEDVFKEKMFRDEFLNLELNGRQTSPRGSGNTLKPTRTSVQREELTPETIEEKLKTLPEAERKQWYNDHLDEINQVLGRSTQV